MKQQLFESFFWYFNFGDKGCNSISSVYSVFSIVTWNVGSVFPYWPSILCWNNLLKSSGSPVMNFSSIALRSRSNQCLNIYYSPWNKYVSLDFDVFLNLLTIVSCQIMTNCNYKLSYKSIDSIFLLVYGGIFCGSFGLFLKSSKTL